MHEKELEMQSKKTIHVEAYNLAEFCQKSQELLKQGYVFDFDTNANYPTSFGSYFSATVVFPEEEPVQEVIQEPESVFQQEPVLRKGRK